MDSKKTKLFAVRIPLEIWGKLNIIAKKENRTISNTIINALHDFITQKDV